MSAFNQHETIVALQKVHGINFATHYSGVNSPVQITHSISLQFYERFINNLLWNNENISVILDSSSDLKRKYYLTVLFQTIEDNRVILYFYRLIPLGSDEIANGLYTELIY